MKCIHQLLCTLRGHMFYRRLLGALLLLCTLGLSPSYAAPIKVLITYDNPSGSQFSKMGFAYSIMLRNLLGHFDTTVTFTPIQNYQAGQVNNNDVTFYLGAFYDNPLPAAFMSDVASTEKKVVWFKHNLWQLAWNQSYGFPARYGITFSELKGMNEAPTASNPNPGFFDTVTYKNKDLVKYYAYNASTNTINADPDIGVVQITDSAKAQTLVPIKNPVRNETAPYVVRSGNFWYFADVPFSFIGPRDRYLVICDLLHDILGVNTPESRKALVRLEDVSAITSQSNMKALTDYLKGKNIPFSIAVIPFYRDPLGAYNGGVSQEIRLGQATALRNSLNYALQRGGKIVMHGYTHQYGNVKNIHTGVSGDDFEFWNAVNNTPVAEDSTAWAGQRLDRGKLELRAYGYTPFAWEAPHYQSSPKSIKAVPSRFNTTYQRVVYYTSDTPNLTATNDTRDFAVGQFFPYVINKDYYGQRVLPENLGNIEYNICEQDPSSCFDYTWQDLYTNAQHALLVRDGFASFFFHPFWLEPELGLPGLNDLKSLVDGINGLGFTWTDASTL